MVFSQSATNLNSTEDSRTPAALLRGNVLLRKIQCELLLLRNRTQRRLKDGQAPLRRCLPKCHIGSRHSRDIRGCRAHPWHLDPLGLCELARPPSGQTPFESTGPTCGKLHPCMLHPDGKNTLLACRIHELGHNPREGEAHHGTLS